MSDTQQPPPSYDYDSIPEGYYDRICRREKGIQSKWHHLEYAFVAREIPQNAAHLDVACGPGTFVSTLPSTVRSIGVDVALPQIEYARKYYAAPNRAFEAMQPGTLPFPNESFDVVTALELLEHITGDEARRLLRECMRVLKKGGRLVVTTPNYASAWPILEWMVNLTAPVGYKYQHITHYKIPSLRNLLGGAGFELVDVAGFQFSASFHAMLSWRLADWVESHEPKCIVRRFGNLLFGIARKP